MKLNVSSLEKALSQLELSMSYLQSELASNDPGLRMQFRAAAIQAFEFTFELAARMIRRQVAELAAVPAEVSQMSYRDLIREAAGAGLITDPESFFHYREIRNITTRTYDEGTAERVLGVLGEFRKDVLVLLRELKRRNHGED